MKAKLPIDTDIKAFLDEKVLEYNNPAFVEFDPISVPHRYSLKEDIEIAGFLAATISWGSRPQIVRAGHKIMDIMGDSPFDFVMSHSQRQMERFDGFVYRTFNSDDLKYFIGGLRHIYKKHGGIEQLFIQYATDVSLQPAIHHFRNHFFEPKHMNRTEKHISDPFKGSAAKKINMYLRWLIRNDKRGVDLGIWKSLRPSQLSCPLDVHSGGIARKLGLLNRKQNDQIALAELDANLRTLDASDPVKYDFALFGLGIFDRF
ncbi:TIGR02757 family protein [uncultured Mucilaginibacter sp.]|uniref:TIGR02757 family protein n=1 Tax=uncultured Mucilaginibacter sp. TaxID=797541 RepID=UPI0025F7949E|nr:TIGR02757 family protein [uncultured Mucilaginibacter sp.]